MIYEIDNRNFSNIYIIAEKSSIQKIQYEIGKGKTRRMELL